MGLPELPPVILNNRRLLGVGVACLPILALAVLNPADKVSLNPGVDPVPPGTNSVPNFSPPLPNFDTVQATNGMNITIPK